MIFDMIFDMYKCTYDIPNVLFGIRVTFLLRETFQVQKLSPYLLSIIGQSSNMVQHGV